MSPCNVPNRTIFTYDNLDVMEGINSDCIDLIYLDPPFNKKKVFTAPIGSHAEGADFKDIFDKKDVKAWWLDTIKERDIEEVNQLYHYLHAIQLAGNPANFAYLCYMAIRLLQCERILKPTGSLYLHCDQTMSHYLKQVLDCIFGEANFVNEIVWCYRTGGQSKYHFGRKHDTILFYRKDAKSPKFNVLPDKSYLTGQLSHSTKNKTYHDEWGAYQNILFSKTKIKLYKDARGYFTLTGCRDYWNIDAVGRTASERVGYPTPKPLALLRRIIAASSDTGDIVLDPFCGCATTCIAAAQTDRQWIGIDISPKTCDLIQHRYAKEVDQDQNNRSADDSPIQHAVIPPTRTDHRPRVGPRRCHHAKQRD